MALFQLGAHFACTKQGMYVCAAIAIPTLTKIHIKLISKYASDVQ